MLLHPFGNIGRQVGRGRAEPEILTERSALDVSLEVTMGSGGKGYSPSILGSRIHSHLGFARRREINAVSFFS